MLDFVQTCCLEGEFSLGDPYVPLGKPISWRHPTIRAIFHMLDGMFPLKKTLYITTILFYSLLTSQHELVMYLHYFVVLLGEKGGT